MKLDNRAKDSIVKVLTLFGAMVALTVVLALILDYLTPAANAVQVNTNRTAVLTRGVSPEIQDEMVEDDEVANEESEVVDRIDKPLIETESKEDGKFSQVEEILIEFESEEGQVVPEAETTLIETGSEESVDSLDEYVEMTGEAIGELFASVGEFLFETEQQTEIQETEPLLETEALMELKSIDFSDYSYDESWAVALAQLAWAEGRGLSMREQSLVMWTVLNRVDAGYDGCTDFWSILTAPYQFAYSPNNPYEEYEYRIAVDVLQRWAAEKDGVEESGRTLPKGYLYYWGDGAHNYFGMNGFGNELWFGLGDPYENW